MSDPFHPLSRGRHRTDDGVAYHAGGPGEHPADIDFLFGRQVDVMLLPFVYSPGARPQGPWWAAVLVELNLSMPEVDLEALHTAGELTYTGDRMGEVLARKGMAPTPQGTHAEPPDQDGPVRWVVRTAPRGHRPSGVFAPGPGGIPSGWVVGSPLPRLPARVPFRQVVEQRGGQAVVFVTTHTLGLCHAAGQVFMDGLNAEAAAGRLWSTRAAVIGPMP